MKATTIENFSEELAGKCAVPGGGAAGAAGAAFGCSLGEMVCELTIGKKKFAEFDDINTEDKNRLDDLRKAFLQLMQKDADLFWPLSKAYGLPKTTDQEIEVREKILEAALLTASSVPLELLEKTVEALDIIERITQHCSKLAVSDAGVGSGFLCTAAYSGYLNVIANTSLMKDQTTADELEKKAKALYNEAEDIKNVIQNKVQGMISRK